MVTRRDLGNCKCWSTGTGLNRKMVPELGNYFSEHEWVNELAWGKRVRRAAGAPKT